MTLIWFLLSTVCEADRWGERSWSVLLQTEPGLKVVHNRPVHWHTEALRRETRICFILIPLKSQRPHKQDDLSLISWASIKIFILSAFFCWLLPMETPKVFTQTCTTTHTLYKSQLETWILPLHWGWSFLCPTCFCGHSSPVLLICCWTVAVSFTAVQFYSYSTKPQQCRGRGTEGY